jgi:hypothetical protein
MQQFLPKMVIYYSIPPFDEFRSLKSLNEYEFKIRGSGRVRTEAVLLFRRGRWQLMEKKNRQTPYIIMQQ